MRRRISDWVLRCHAAAGAQLRKAELMVFLPAVTLAAFWLGGEQVLILVALGLPLVFAFAGAFRFGAQPPAPGEAMSGIALPARVVGALDAAFESGARSGLVTGCLVVQFDDVESLLDRHGRAAQAEVLAQAGQRLASVLRPGDTVARLEGGGFAVALAPVRRLDLETMVQVAARLQAALATPFSIDRARLYVTVSVGFCLGVRSPGPTGNALLDAAQVAADEALRNGPGAIRAYAPDMARTRADRDAMRDILEGALENGQIVPWFQPQVSTDTGAITGFEALARWNHPDRGLVAPGEFLTAIEEAGLAERLGEVMLYHALQALLLWDKAGLRVPTVAVNFSAAELRNPRLTDKLKWEIDRFGLSPERLSVEILETVVADTDNDVVVANIAQLSRLGCGIDLDDFGTGHASIANIRRFAVRRIKIDRSFVTKVDEDRDQQRMVSAVLSLAERLGLDTLAEGVETAAEHAMLSQLGCGHVQGFVIARPMPFAETTDWIAAYRAKISVAARITHRAR